MRRLPARESRWRRCWPDEASSGAVPFQAAECPRLANRVMSPMSPMSRAAPDGPMPCGAWTWLPEVLTSWVSCRSAGDHVDGDQMFAAFTDVAGRQSPT
jgi:hypothetical protein